MKNKTAFWIAFASAGTMLLLFGACSIIGLAIGSGTPKKYTLERRVPVYEMESVDKGANIIVYHQGKITEGSFSAVKTKEPGDANSKVLAMEINIPNSVAQTMDLPFTEIDSVLLKEKVKLQKGQQWSNGWEIVRIPTKTKLEIHKKEGGIVNGKYLKAEKVDPAADQYFNQLKIQDSSGTVRHIPVSEISYVVCTGNTTYAMKGFIIGLGLDVLAAATITGILTSGDWFKLEYTGSSSANSCPYIYSSTGQRYQFEGEMFVGAFFKGAQKTDVMPLNYLHPINGTCRVRITNELNETEYVDEVSLLAVDHPMGTRVIPSGDGQLWVLGSTIFPRKATDLAGADVTADLSRHDDRGWLSNPFGRNPDNPKDLRDGLVLQFDRPLGADTATLSLGVKNTFWTVALQTQLQTLPGRYRAEWYSQMEQSQEAREALAAAMVREIMLHVSAWDGHTWRPCGYVWELGAVAERDIVLQIPLQGLPAESNLLVRLDCPPGTWIVDCAEIDYHATPVKAQGIPLTHATDGSGRDVSATLRNIDGLYYEMPHLYQYADLEFVVPQPPVGFEQSLLVQSTGYYHVRVAAEGEPQTVLMNQLIQEPGAFNRYALQQLNRAIGSEIRGAPASF